MIDTVWS